MNEKNFTQKREELVKPYSELGQELKKEQWGVSEYKDELIRSYTNPELIKDVFTKEIINWIKERNIDKNQGIRIVDFGGGDGVLINTVIQQLKDSGYDKATGVNLDFTEKSLNKMKTDYLDQSDDLYAIRGDITQMPVKESSVDIGISRYMLQYFGKEKQTEILENILATLKPGSKLIMQLPSAGETNEQAQFINEFNNKINALVSGTSFEEAMKNKYFPALEDIEKLAKELDVKCTANFVEGLKHPISAEVFFDRFQIINDEQKKKIFEIFNSQHYKQKASELGGMNFIEKNGIMYVEMLDAKIIFEK